MKWKLHGYVFALVAIVLFATQDGLSKHLATSYPPIFITMIRYWAFAAFVLLGLARSHAGVRQATVTRHPVLQMLRGLLLIGEILLFVFSLTQVGLAMTQAIFQAAPILVTALSVPLLGERVGWRRWVAVTAGMIGVLIILSPTGGRLSAALLLPLASALLFAIYSVATRAVSYKDSSSTSLLYTAVVGAIAISLFGPLYWTPISSSDLPLLAALCICGALSHYCLIRAYAILEASEVQPLAYLQLVAGTGIAVSFFGEQISRNMIVGAAIVVAAGVFIMWRGSAQLECADSLYPRRR
ncbi:DMT family transporter [Ensifer sp. IC3342]|nr:DMT family transporter [Ensifer sp. BRP08]MCA1450969.1 DMT family transporter [Ensifer sp. IC3342]